MEAYKIPLKDIFAELKTSENGLSNQEVQKRLAEFGKNEIKRVRKRPILFDFIEQFTNLFALILIFAGFLSLFLGNGRDAVILFLIVFLNAIVGFFQEFKAEKTIEALQKIVPKETTVKRDGKLIRINVVDIVDGDVVVLQAGDTVPADLRLTKAYNLKTNDFVLTGESVSQEKFACDVPHEKDLVVTDVDNCLFTGMQVTDGSAEGVVFATGMDTEFGKIAHLTSDVKREQSPLQKEIDIIGKRVTKLVAVILPIMFAIFYFTNKGTFNFFNAFQFSIGVSSAMVPEGLVATVSIALAIGVQRVAKKRAVIRKLSSVETLGAVSVIVTDKTGTLTKNEMTVKELYIPDKNIHVRGVGYSSSGGFIPEGRKKFDTDKNSEIFEAIVLCNNAEISFDKDGNASKAIGDQMEVALLVMGRKAGYKKEDLLKKFPRKYEIAFDSTRRMMSVVHESGDKNTVYTKGSPDDVLAKCSRIMINGRTRKIKKEDIKVIRAKNDVFASDALRVLAVATKEIKPKKDKYLQSEVERELTFLGLVGIIDPPRTDVAGAIKECRGAGIKIFMVTGDYGITAEAIGKRIGLSDNPVVVTGDDLKKLDDFDLGKILNFGMEGCDGIIFARTTPEDKMRIVSVLKKYDYIVAVTGDGVNDAPALKSAHIGVAMGITGTDVSKEASEMVLLNDSFSSIVSAIREGRTVYANTKKFVYYIFSSNATEFFVVLIGSFFGLMPMFAIQILLIDLCTDVFPSLALAVDPSEKDIMEKKPRDPHGKLLGFDVFKSLFRVGIVGGALGFITFLTVMVRGGWVWGDFISLDDPLFLQATAATYATLVICQVFNSIEARSEELGIFKIVFGNKKLLGAIGISIFLLMNVIYNPWIQPFAKTAAIEPINWVAIISAGLIFLFAIEFSKHRKKENMILERIKNWI